MAELAAAEGIDLAVVPDDDNGLYRDDEHDPEVSEDGEGAPEGTPETPAEPAAEPAAEPTVEPVAEAAPEPPATPAPDVVAQAESYKRFEEAFANDPVRTLGAMLDALTPEQRSQLGVAPPAKPEAIEGLPEGWEPASDFEAQAAPLLASLRQDVSKMSDVAGERVEQGMQQIAPYIDHLGVETETVGAKVEAILQYLGLELPDADREAVAADLRKPNVTYKQAVRSRLEADYKARVAARKQADAPRPQTPGNKGSVMARIQPGANMRQIERAMREAGIL
jgi:hypothetical protein